MSGPKYSRAYIRELQRLKQLERQLAEQVEQSKRKQVLSDIARLEKLRKECCSDSILSECQSLIPQAEKLIPNSKVLAQIKALVSDVLAAQSACCDTSGNSDELLQRYSAQKKAIEKLQNSVQLLKDLKKQIAAEGTVALQEKRSQEFSEMEWSDTGERIDTIPSDLQDVYLEVIELLAEFPDFEEKKKILDNTIMKTGDVEYKKKQLELRRKALVVERNSSQDNLKLLTLDNELRGLYTLLGWEAKQIPTDVSELEKAIAEAREEADKRQKNQYIAECLYKVFKEKGYTLVDDVVVTSNGAQVQKGFFEFGEDSLINVSMSAAGQMLFEVVGDGTAGGMDETRAAQLESEMRRFCPNYAEIKEILEREYGISLEDEHLCEPDRKYAKAVDVSEPKSQRRAKKEKKMMHYDD